MDREVAKFLGLPFFDHEFKTLIVKINFANIEKFHAADALTPEQFYNFVIVTSEALAQLDDGSCCEKTLTMIMNKELQFKALWSLVSNAGEILFTKSVTVQGYGLAARSGNHLKTSGSVPYKKVFCDKKISGREPGSRATSSEIANTLLDHERSLKAKWIDRLEKIADRAGSNAEINEQFRLAHSELSLEEMSKIKKTLFGMGAYRTLQTHIRHWERLEKWAQGRPNAHIYPLTLDTALKYILYLDQKGCGPSVIPSVRACITWMGSRLKMNVPDMADPQVVALETGIIEIRGKELKEAVPVPLLLVGLCELYLEEHLLTEVVVSLLLGWVLCMIYASLRFSDAVHVKTSTLELRNEGLFGVAWQTKVERKRRGTKFAVPTGGLRSTTWLGSWFTLFQDRLGSDRDFWMFDIVNRHKFAEKPIAYDHGLKWVKYSFDLVVLHSFRSGEINDAQLQELKQIILSITWHSMRVTLLDEAVHREKHSEAIAIQANWSSGNEMVLKYTRNRREVPLKMISSMITEIKNEWKPKAREPGEADADHGCEFSEEDELEDDLTRIFYMKKSLFDAPTARISVVRYHVVDPDDATLTACKRIKISECCPVGSVAPDSSMICKVCARGL